MIDRHQLRQDMDVLDSDGQRVGKIDAIEGGRIKLIKDASPDGEHQYVMLDDVARVDGEYVHLSGNRDAVLGAAASAATVGATSAKAHSPLPEIKNPAVDSASVLPTLRSIPLVRMTSVIPSAITPISDTCLRMSVRLPTSRKIRSPVDDLGLSSTANKRMIARPRRPCNRWKRIRR